MPQAGNNILSENSNYEQLSSDNKIINAKINTVLLGVNKTWNNFKIIILKGTVVFTILPKVSKIPVKGAY